MHSEVVEVSWISEEQAYSLPQLAELAGASEELLRELVACGAIIPLALDGDAWVFAGATITAVRAARRLGDDLELEPHGVALALALFERIRQLEAQLAAAHARLPPAAR